MGLVGGGHDGGGGCKTMEEGAMEGGTLENSREWRDTMVSLLEEGGSIVENRR